MGNHDANSAGYDAFEAKHAATFYSFYRQNELYIVLNSTIEQRSITEEQLDFLAGELEVTSMLYSIDFGSTWQECELESPANRLAWQHFKGEAVFPKKGYYELWARAVDSNGNAQPMVLPGWNPKGYLNNACHRIAIKVV